MSVFEFLKAALLAVVASLLPLMVVGGFLVMEQARAAGAAPVGLILDGLPPADTPAYRALVETAGNPTVQPLDMTHAEMWQVAPDRLDTLLAAAQARGVAVMRLDANWNRVLAPMAEGTAMTKQQAGMMHDAMGSKAAMGLAMMAAPDPRIVEYALTKDMNDAGAPEQELVIPLDATTSVAARRTGIERTGDGYIWRGIIAGTEEPVTLMWWPTGRFSGQITYRGHVYVVKHMGGDMHGIIEMAPKMLPPEHAPMGKALQEKMKMREDPLVKKGDASMLRKGPAAKSTGEDIEHLKDARTEGTPAHDAVALRIPQTSAPAARVEPTTITLLVAYTRAAARHYTDIEKDLLSLALADANQSFRNSGIGNVRLELVRAYETAYAEKGTHFEHVFAFADKGDGLMEEVHALREDVRADIALLVVDDANGCGLAAGVAPAADRAFAVVHHECAALKYSIAHEIGHIIGARHDTGLDDSMHPFPYGHGFVHGTAWRTMMSYEESCGGCPRLPIWSSPRIMVRGVAAGDATADNARVISGQAARVAAFR